MKVEDLRAVIGTTTAYDSASLNCSLSYRASLTGTFQSFNALAEEGML